MLMVAVGLLLIVSGAVVVLRTPSETAQIRIGTATVNARVARSPMHQARGLSGTEALEADEGMLFVRTPPDVPHFWMKDMRFDIDIIWIGPDARVLGVVAAVQPDSYPSLFSPPASVGWVLEVPAGVAARHSIATGSSVLGLP
jgi:hypothetical protein